jgi:hypothetical protein
MSVLAHTVAEAKLIHAWLVDVLNGHRLKPREDDGWILLEGSEIAFAARVLDSADSKPDLVILQVDFGVRLANNTVIIQQCVGFGATRAAALEGSKATFMLGTLHAVLSALVTGELEHVDTEELNASDGRRIVATFGSSLTRTDGPSVSDNGDWRAVLTAVIAKADLPEGVHWIDLYHFRGADDEMIEGQIDNNRSSWLEEEMRAARWPTNSACKFVSVRQFVIVQDVSDPSRPARRANPARHSLSHD